MGKNNDDYTYVGFGQTMIDMDEEDFNPVESLRDCLSDEFFKIHSNPEKCCKYLCQLNNFIFEHGKEYPQRISQINPLVDFIYVIMIVTHKLPDENIEDFPKFFNTWIDFLNDNADAIDRVSGYEQPSIVTCDRFFEKVKRIVENG